MSRMRMRSFAAFRNPPVMVWLLAAVCLFSTPAFSITRAQRLEKARVYFQQAEELREALQQVPAEERTRRNYEKLIQAYKRVYLTAPTYGNNSLSLMAIAELYREMGRLADTKKDYAAAIRAYEFLVKEYPHSKYRFEALWSVAEVYRDELMQPDKAVEAFEAYRKKYPRSPQAAEARRAIDAIQRRMAEAEVEAETPEAIAEAAPPETPLKPSKGIARLTGIRHWATPTYTRVVIDVENPVRYRVGRLSKPERIYFDLYSTKVDRELASQPYPVEYGLLKQVRVGQNRSGVSRVVLDLGEFRDYSVFELPNPYRLVIDIHSGVPGGAPPPLAAAIPSPPAEATAQTEPVQSAEAAVVAEEPKIAASGQETAFSVAADSAESVEETAYSANPVAEKVQTAQPNRNGSHSLIRALGLKIGRIMIDPGHGGHDTGTIGPSGLREKDLVLNIAQRLGKMIAERLGSEVFYTREADAFVPLETRTAIANEKQTDLFISIHANGSRSRRTRGIETYYLNLTTDPEALEVAARENAVSQESIFQLQDLVQRIAMQDKMEESREFATHVQASLNETIAGGKMRNRGVKKAPFVVLIGANMPSILAEISFLSNPQDEKLLRTSEHRQKVAEALYEGIEKYVDSLSGVKVARTAGALAVASQ